MYRAAAVQPQAAAAAEFSARTPARRTHWTARASRISATGIVGMVTEAAQRHGVPIALAHAVIKMESGYNCRARSAYGARGIGQVLPASAKAEGVSGNLFECATGLEASMRYLSHALALFGGGCSGLSAYNLGLSSHGQCTGYGRRALRLAQLFR